MKKVIAILFFLLAAGAVIFMAMYPSIKHKAEAPVIANFQQCVDAGYPVRPSYPRECTLPSGKYFVDKMVPGR